MENYDEPIIPSEPAVDYEAVLADLRRYRDALTASIDAIERLLAGNPTITFKATPR